LGGHGSFQGLEGLDVVKQHPDFRRVLLFAKPGMVFRPYPHFDGFIGFILGQHRDAHGGQAFINMLNTTIRTIWS
jgi:hypothetical protein